MDKSDQLTKKLFELSESDFNYALLPYLADILTDSQSPKIQALRLVAWYELRARLANMRNDGYDMRLISGIAKKKGALILKISTQSELEKLLNPPPPHYDGNRFIPNEGLTSEEELLAWSKASLNVVLIDVAVKRCLDLFQTLYPDKYKELFTD